MMILRRIIDSKKTTVDQAVVFFYARNLNKCTIPIMNIIYIIMIIIRRIKDNCTEPSRGIKQELVDKIEVTKRSLFLSPA